MKNIILALILANLLAFQSKSQTVYVTGYEFDKIMDAFIGNSNQNIAFSASKSYIVRIIKDSIPFSYSLALTTVVSNLELPPSVFAVKFRNNKYFFISKDDSITVLFDSRDKNIDYNPDAIKHIADSLLSKTRGGYVYFPTIYLYKVVRDNSFMNYLTIKYFTYHPINTLSKKYWPVDKTLQWAETIVPLDDFMDENGLPNETYFSFIIKGKGEFRIPKLPNK